MPRIPLAAAVLLLSVLVIGGALFFEYGLGLVPCEICLLERWPWYAAIVASGAVLALRRKLPAATLIFALLFLVSGGLGFYHVGVETHVFAGPDACTAPKLGSGSVDDLLKQLRATPVVRCDEPQWSLFGISLAGWNLVASLGMLVLCTLFWRYGRRAEAAA